VKETSEIRKSFTAVYLLRDFELSMQGDDTSPALPVKPACCCGALVTCIAGLQSDCGCKSEIINVCFLWVKCLSTPLFYLIENRLLFLGGCFGVVFATLPSPNMAGVLSQN